MSVYIERLKKIINQFEDKDKEELVEFYKSTTKEVLFDDKEIGRTKIDLLNDIFEIDNKFYAEISKDVMKHKVLQTRALILDLVTTDYSSDIECIYKEEGWIHKIIKDIKNTFLYEDKHEKVRMNNKEMLCLYNQFLIKELEDIFLSEVEQFGSNGNQLVINIYFYKRFILNYLEYDFDIFVNKLKKQIPKEKVLKEDDLNQILNDCK